MDPACLHLSSPLSLVRVDNEPYCSGAVEVKTKNRRPLHDVRCEILQREENG
jgi:hypothetical protein